MEFDLLAFLLAHPGIVMSRERLLERVWGLSFPGGTRTVDVHVAQLRRKLDRPDLIRTVRGSGLQGGGVSRLHGPRSLRARLFVGIAATLAVSTVVMLAVGAALTRRSLDHDSRSALDRQVELIVAQHAANPLPAGETDARPLPRHRAGARWRS